MTSANVTRNSIWGGAANFFAMAVNIVVILAVSNKYGAYIYGCFSLLISLLNLFISFNQGFYTGTIKKIINDKQRGVPYEVIHLSMLMYAVVVALLMMLIVNVFDAAIVDALISQGNGRGEVVGLFLVLSCAYFIISFSKYIAAIIEAEGFFAQAAKARLCFNALILLSIGVVCFFELKIISLAYGYVASGFFELMVVVYYFKRYRESSRFIRYKRRSKLIRAAFISLPSLMKDAFLLQVSGMLNNSIDFVNRVIISKFISVEYIAVYDIALKLLSSVRNVFISAFRSFMQISYDLNEVAIFYKKIIPPVIVLSGYSYFMASIVISFMQANGIIANNEELIDMIVIMSPLSILIIAISPFYNIIIVRANLRYILFLNIRLFLINLFAALILVEVIGIYAIVVGLMLSYLFNIISVARTGLQEIGSIESRMMRLDYYLIGIGVIDCLMIAFLPNLSESGLVNMFVIVTLAHVIPVLSIVRTFQRDATVP